MCICFDFADLCSGVYKVFVQYNIACFDGNFKNGIVNKALSKLNKSSSTYRNGIIKTFCNFHAINDNNNSILWFLFGFGTESAVGFPSRIFEILFLLSTFLRH